MRLASILSFVALSSAALFVPREASALMQPNGTPIPTAPGCASGQPSGLLAAFACACTQPNVCNIGAPCASMTSCDNGMHGTCESTMWHAFNDNTCIPSQHSGLDPVSEASTTPETFRPTCALTFTILTRGTSQFRDVFGWYNVTGQKPAPSDLHPMLGCGDNAGHSVVLDLTHEPSYMGGEIGFFLMTPENHNGSKQCAGGDCCPTTARIGAGDGYVFYSQRALNPDAMGTSSFIHLLTYNSHLSRSKFYFAWEDLLSGGDNNFTDLVTSVDGVQCSGGGVACDTGKKGLCAYGVTECAQGTVSCTALNMPKPEVCDGIDDDCNGIVDDNATCPTAGDVCQNGKCVRPCTKGEFRCANGTTCSTSGLCVDPACANVSCAADKICRGGTCVAACDGVVCPHGQTCVNDKCVDLCAGVACAGGQVCRQGVCFAGCAACDGVTCGAGLKCDGAKNDCVDPSCANGCPNGTFCKAGSCVDGCDGAKCPAGQACVMGYCGGPPDGGAGDGGIHLGTDPDGGTGDGGSNAADGFGDAHKSGCACDVVGGGDVALGAPAIGAAIAALFARRRRKTVR